MTNTDVREEINALVKECRSIIDACKKEERNMTEDEKKRFDECKEEIETKKRELILDEEENKEEETKEETKEEVKEEVKEEPKEETKDETKDEEIKEEEKQKDKNTRNITMKNTLVKELRNALDNNIKTVTVNAETRAITVDGYTPSGSQSPVPGVHNNLVETEIQGILEPLYANSVLTKLGVKWYKGLPMGDISVPVQGKGQVGWAAEIAEAGASNNTFTNVTLQPKRLTAFVDISKKLIAQDTIQAENAIRADIVNALYDKLEATIFGDAAGDTTKPAGIFYNATVTQNNTYVKVAEAEATVEAANVYGNMAYVMAPSTKAFYRTLAKGQNSGFVWEANEMDGVPAIVTSNVAANKYVYGAWENLAVGSWGDIDITIDPYTQAVNGCVRLTINAYFDAKILRPEAFAFGKTVA